MRVHALVSGDHVLDVNVGVFSSILLEQLKRLLDQVADVLAFVLGVFDLVSQVNWVCMCVGFQKLGSRDEQTNRSFPCTD